MDFQPMPLATMVRRELLTSLRSWKSFVLLVLLLLLLFYAASETMGMTYIYANRATAMMQFFQIQIWSLYLVATAIVPAMAAVSINTERESGNWDLLGTTLIPSTRIVLGKYLAVLVYYLLFCVAVLPLMGLVYFYAGVDVYRFFDALLWIVPAALCNAAFGIWASHTCSKTSQAVIRAFGLIILSGVLFAGAMALDQYMRFGPGRANARFSPLSILPPSIAQPWRLYGIYQLSLGAFFLGVTLYAARERTSAVTRSVRSAAASVAQARARIFGAPLLWVPDGANPFGFRELYGNAIQRKSVALLACILVAVIYFGLYALMHELFPGSESGMGIIERILLLGFVPPLVAIAMVREREETTLDMYRMTLCSTGEFLIGKFLGLLRQWRVILIALLLCKLAGIGLLALDDFREVDMPGYVFILDILSLPVHLCLVMAVAMMGAVFPKSTVAAIGAASGCVFAGLMVYLYLQGQIMMESHGSEEEVVALFFVSNLMLSCLFIGVSAAIGLARVTALWKARD